MKLLAIETSCDETAVALLELTRFLDGGFLGEAVLLDLVSSQAKLHEPYGGVVPELAAREHIVNLPALVREALASISVADIGAIAVTQGPGLKGCLLVGLCFAKAFAFARRIPLFPVNHLQGHLVAPYLVEPKIELPMLALIVSGGHTLLVLIPQVGDCQVVANTRDDAAGEAFDKIASLLGLPYPGGPALSALADSGNAKRFDFPAALAADPSSFSFSGLKTAVSRALPSSSPEATFHADIAASAQDAIIRALISKTEDAVRRYRPKTLSLGGGVAANRLLREQFRHLGVRYRIPAIVPPHRWCTDNATMIGAAAALQIRGCPELLSNWQLRGDLGPGVPFSLTAESRFPLGT